MAIVNNTQSGLAALLDALEKEILAAHADDVCNALHETARARNVVCQEGRLLLNQAVAASEDSSTAPPPTEISVRGVLFRTSVKCPI
jgi:hypothetical protein